jgi:WD40 repeat protein
VACSDSAAEVEAGGLAVTGTSGSGKSSLVRTGLLDALDRGLLAEAGADWRIADFHPGGQPLAALANALLDMLGVHFSKEDSLRAQAVLARGPLGLLEWLRGTDLPEYANVLLLADQFEEIFRYRAGPAADDINAFVALLLASARQRERPVYVVITMRSDFLGECAQFIGLAEAINDGQYLTPRLTREQCQQVIEGPAAVFGGRVEPALVTRLLNDLGSNADQLPLVQHVLMRLWRIAVARDGGSPQLTLQDYEKLGGIGIAQPAQLGLQSKEGGEERPANALSAHADEILSELTEDQRQLAAILFRALTESQGAGGRDVRRPITLSEAAAIAGVPPGAMIPVVEAFRGSDRNLLTPPTNISLGPETVIDISHESLIRQWGTLRKWVREEYLAAETYRHVEATAKLWRQGNAALFTMPYLGIALNWREREHPNAFWAKRYGDSFELAMDFLRQSQEAHSQRIEAEERTRRRSTIRTRAIAIAMSVLFIIATGFAYFGFEAAKRAQKNETAAKISTLEAEKSKNVANEMSLRAARDRTIAQKGQSIYLATLAYQRFLKGDLLQSLLLSTEALPDERHGIRRDEVRPAKEMLMRGYHQFAAQQSPMTQSTISYFQFLPSTDRLLTTSYDGTARLWDHNGRFLTELKGHLGAVSGADVTVGGQLIATASYDGGIRIWSAETGALLNFLWNTGGRLYGVSFRRDGKAVVTAGPGSVARLWDTQTGQMVREFSGHSDDLTSATFSPDGSQVLTTSEDNTARVWDTNTGKLLKTLKFLGTEYILRAKYTPDGSQILTMGDERSLGIWDAKSFALTRRLRAEAGLETMAISRNGLLMAIGSEAAEHSVIVLNLSNGSRVLIKNYGQKITRLAFTPDDSNLITAGTDTTLRIWDARTGSQIKRLETDARVLRLAISNDGRRVATISQRGTISVWDTVAGHQCDCL